MRGTYLHLPTSVGPSLAAWSEQGVAYVGFHAQAEAGLAWCRAQWPRAQWQQHQGPVPDWLQRMAALQPGPCPVLDLSASTALQRAVWQALQQVPWGQRCSYAELAARVQQPRAVRAVASAVARNRWAWLVPCHRVWRSNGAVGGFRWGVPLKHALCAHEQAQPAAGAA
jgi:AraC family transcriptional regulator of adaptative response/methylated-DNA-[protein]-cysteine methyltransferase